MRFGKNNEISSLKEELSFLEDEIFEKNLLISVQERDMESLKREIVLLKKELNYSKQKKK